MASKIVMGILIDHRTKAAVKVQEVLTQNGCLISGRFGVHEVTAGNPSSEASRTTGEYCSDEGLIVLTISGSKSEADAMAKSLKAVDGVKVNLMEL